jgi:hypothetical protein
MLDGKTVEILQYVDRTFSGFYAEQQARKSGHLRVVDLNLPLTHRNPTIKQACAQLIDSLMDFQARAIVVDLFFDPALDTTGRAELLRAAKNYSNTIWGFYFRKDSDAQIAGLLRRFARHAVPYASETKEKVQNWPDYHLQRIEPVTDGLAEMATRMGFLDIFPENNGRIQFYPLFHRLAGVDSVFAGLSTQALRLWVETEGGNGNLPAWPLDDYFVHLGLMSIDWENDYRLKIHRIAAPLRPGGSRSPNRRRDVCRQNGFDRK